MNEMTESLQRHEAEAAKMAEKLMHFKNELIDRESKMKLFSVAKIGTLHNAAAQV